MDLSSNAPYLCISRCLNYMHFYFCYALSNGYQDKTWRIRAIPLFIWRPINFITIGMTTGVAQSITDRNIDCELRAIYHMSLDSISTLLPMVISCDCGSFFFRLPRSLVYVTPRCKFTDRELQCTTHASEAR